MSRSTTGKLLRTIVAALIAVPFLVPFLFLASMGLRPQADYLANPLGFPSELTFDNVTGAWDTANLGRAMVGSLVTSVIGVVVAAVLSASTAFWFILHPSERSNRIRLVLGAGYVFPAVIWLIPLFVLLSRRGLTNNWVILGIIYGVSNLPFGLFLVHSFYRQTLRSEILDAASLDGATGLQQFWRIALPLSRPALAALAALVFVWSFGDLLFAVTMIQDPDRWTITIAAATLVSRDGISVSAQAGAAIVSLLPSLAIVVVAQKALVRGFGGGSTD